MKEKKFTIRNLPESLHRKLKIKAAQTGKPMELLVIEALKKELIKN